MQFYKNVFEDEQDFSLADHAEDGAVSSCDLASNVLGAVRERSEESLESVQSVVVGQGRPDGDRRVGENSMSVGMGIG